MLKKLWKRLTSSNTPPSQQMTGLGWKRDLPDPRDHKFRVTSPLLFKQLPKSIDLRNSCPMVYDQGRIGSCTANALGAAFQFEQIKQGIDDFIPSRLFVYYNTRTLEGTVSSDAGATLRNTMKTMVTAGVCPEKMWKYYRSWKKEPTKECYDVAMENQVLEYLRVTHSLDEIKLCLADGHPVAFGMMLYESFMSDDVTRHGYVPFPKLGRERGMGGHAVLAVGYDDGQKHLIVRNSWGDQWGDGGYFYLPYEYITTPNLTADFWTIKLVENPNE